MQSFFRCYKKTHIPANRYSESGHKIIIDMDIFMENPELLAKLHERANLMIISSTFEPVKPGYNMLEIVDDCMAQLKRKSDTI